MNSDNGMYNVGMMVDYDGTHASMLNEVSYFLCQHISIMVVDDGTHACKLEKVSFFFILNGLVLR